MRNFIIEFVWLGSQIAQDIALGCVYEVYFRCVEHTKLSTPTRWNWSPTHALTEHLLNTKSVLFPKGLLGVRDQKFLLFSTNFRIDLSFVDVWVPAARAGQLVGHEAPHRLEGRFASPGPLGPTKIDEIEVEFKKQWRK